MSTVGHFGAGSLSTAQHLSGVPFLSVAAFHDWLATDYGKSTTMRSSLSISSSGTNTNTKATEHRAALNDGLSIVLTHGQLEPVNVLVGYPDGEPDAGPRIVAVVDWSMAGWLPLHWEHYVEPCSDTPQCILH